MKYLILIILSCLCFRISAQPHLVWADNFYSGGWDDVGNTIMADDSGNVYVAGAFSDTMDADPGPGVYYLESSAAWSTFICKISPYGELIWAKSIDRSYTRSMQRDAAGNLFLAGFFGSTADFDPGLGVQLRTSSGGNDGFILKLSPSGDFQNVWCMGGDVITWISDIALDDAGNIYGTGSVMGTADCDPGPGVFNITSSGDWDIFVVRLDSAGNFKWVKCLGESADWDLGTAICLDANANVYFTGHFANTMDFDPGPGTFLLSSGGSDDAYVCALDSAGNFIRAGAFRGTGEQMGFGITTDAAGNVYVAGGFTGLTDFNPGAGFYPVPASYGWNSFICKLSPGGSLAWAKSIKASGEAWSVMLDGTGNVYTTGTARADSVDFDPGPGTYIMQAGYGEQSYLLILDTLGEFRCAGTTGGNRCYSNALAADVKNGFAYITGYIQDTCDLDLRNNPQWASTPSGRNAYVAQYRIAGCSDELTAGISASPSKSGPTIFPNPSHDIYRISQRVDEHTRICVYDASGRKINCPVTKSGEIDLGGQPAGIYLLRLENNEKVFVRNLVHL
jgi:hypothetical protein